MEKGLCIKENIRFNRQRWERLKSKLYKFIKDKREEEGFSEKLFSNFVSMLKNDNSEELDFLKDNEEFHKLLNNTFK